MELQPRRAAVRDTSFVRIVSVDLLTAQGDYLVHQVHATGGIPDRVSGLATLVFDVYPHSQFSYTLLLGSVQSTPMRGQIGVVNLCAQRNAGAPGLNDTAQNREEWFAKALEALGARVPAGAAILFPHGIGCGIGKGNWVKYEQLIRKFAKRFNVQVTLCKCKTRQGKRKSPASPTLDQAQHNAMNQIRSARRFRPECVDLTGSEEQGPKAVQHRFQHLDHDHDGVRYSCRGQFGEHFVANRNDQYTVRRRQTLELAREQEAIIAKQRNWKDYRIRRTAPDATADAAAKSSASINVATRNAKASMAKKLFEEPETQAAGAAAVPIGSVQHNGFGTGSDHGDDAAARPASKSAAGVPVGRVEANLTGQGPIHHSDVTVRARFRNV